MKCIQYGATLLLAFMRFTFIQTFLAIITGGIIYANGAGAQGVLDKRITLHQENSRVEKILKNIGEKADIRFVYSNNLFDGRKATSAIFKDEDVASILIKLLEPMGIKYEAIDRNYIVLKRKSESVLDNLAGLVPASSIDVQFSESEDRAQITIKGKVSDDNGPLPGVSVKVEGTSSGAGTNAEGEYVVNAPADGALIFSMLGYTTQRVAIQNRTIINITLVQESKLMNEVVVVGYGTQRKINLSGAVDAISAKDLESRPISNIGTGMQGLIPNLNITVGSGQVTKSAEFNIRGFTSITGGSPYILVDNVPFSNNELATLNPNDIESVSVLKDAASAAIYGARGAFGVILISTKSGKSDQLKVSANTYYASRTLGKVPDVVTDPFTVMKYKHDAAFPLYNLFPENIREYAKQRSADPSLPAVIADPSNPQRWQYYGSTNWLEETYNKTAPTYSANVSIAKKDDKLGYYFSTEYFKNDGMLQYGNDIFNRYNLRGKADYKLTSWLSLGNNTSFMYSTYDEPAYGGWLFFHNANRTSSLDVLRNPDGTWASAGASLLGRLQEGGRSNTESNHVQTTFNTNVSLLKGVWELKGDATLRRLNSNQAQHDVPVPYRSGPEQPSGFAGSNPSWAENDTYITKHNIYNLYTDFHKTFEQKHYLQALVGFNQEYRYDNTYWINRKNLISSSLPSTSLATGDITQKETITDWAVRGLFYRLNYIFDNKYIVEFNGRYDGSSRFPGRDRWGFFPSASGSWVLSQEKFFEPVKNIGIDLFKLRASYGSLGNQDVGAYAYIPEMGAGQIGQILNGQRPVAVNPPPPVAPSLTWEKISTLNFGTDLSFLRNRLDINLDVYTRYTTGMLVKSKTLPAVFGAAEPKVNAADLKTKGLELRLGWKDNFMVSNSPFYYDIRLSLADSRSYITKYDNPGKILSDYYEGQEIGEIWGLVTEGFFQSKEELEQHADQTAVGSDDQGYQFDVGDLKFKDLNGDGKVDKGKNTVADPGDMIKIGNSRARLPYSIDLNTGWKGFDLRMFFQGVAKRDWYPGASNHYFWGIYAQPWTNVQAHNLDHWSQENPDGYFPRVKSYIAEDATELGMPQTRYLQNAAYLRLKNLTLGYTLPKALTNRIKVDKLRLYFSAENVFDVSSLKARLDPEGLDGTIYPFQKTFSMGLNLNF